MYSRIKKKERTPEEIEKDRLETSQMWFWLSLLWSKLPKEKYCSNPECKKRIYGENKWIYWDHLLEKEKYPELKYEEENMYFCCGDCHTAKTNGFPSKHHKEAIEIAKQKFLTN